MDPGVLPGHGEWQRSLRLAMKPMVGARIVCNSLGTRVLSKNPARLNHSQVTVAY